MSYEIEFFEEALNEWRRLDSSIRDQLKKKLSKLLEEPRRPANRLHGLDGCYKIKLRSAGVRLVYKVEDGELVILVIAIGKRDKSVVYDTARTRLSDTDK
ncbi:TPA: type II toxin-antitoxin system RelE/ParE family toxin [Salmonella enterica subsp. enterica serovar Derby]|uniref:Type II toxin-antitoxin system RelE/ParE family toxin n=1 Tax=Salmonella derby TaxID=28144 RepID=A0A741QYN7_SALDE|nr:type II toxin-antitoxin system RelE/ParE family toxin [Salmonella enterica subsp. enterica serovar Derby]HAE9618418.1 type II toxin-antitoxin system RelE/ParE family toxin [Salmonella enterica subsp. enterica serovar Typhimurium]HAF0953131.1 type II toxin-antitoxin system RelE/ParE family toxin [Salmonella enterica subsp. enterica serovar Derby]